MMARQGPHELNAVAPQLYQGVKKALKPVKILIDSGSDAHVCPSSFAPSTATSSVTAHRPLRDVQGGPIPTEGTKDVSIKITDKEWAMAWGSRRVGL